jgi:hypothetical protein
MTNVMFGLFELSGGEILLLFGIVMKMGAAAMEGVI